MKSLIFEKPSLAPLPHRIGWTFFTAFFWMLWIYLWMPLVTLCLWALGFMAYGEYMGYNVSSELQELEHTAFIYTITICILGGSLLLWARIEFLRFHNLNRRTKPVPVKLDEIATYANLPVEDLATWENSRRLVAYHDSHGHVIGGDADTPLNQGAT